MHPFTNVTGVVMPLDRANVNTDAIIPAEYLKAVTRTGFADGLFTYWRYYPGTRTPDPSFVLNQPRYANATILLSRTNFGCGSSREHAPWALQEYGFRVIIAAGFADIFHNNSFNNGLLLITLDLPLIDMLFERVTAQDGYSLSIDLSQQTLRDSRDECWHFAIDPYHKQSLLDGQDAIDRTLGNSAAIASHEAQHRQRQSWVIGR